MFLTNGAPNIGVMSNHNSWWEILTSFFKGGRCGFWSFRSHLSLFLALNPGDFTKGVILNRPTAYSTLDLENSLKIENFSHEGVDDWNVWCGGDCQGINSRGRIPPEPWLQGGSGAGKEAVPQSHSD